jgi:hypothetical protein
VNLALDTGELRSAYREGCPVRAKLIVLDQHGWGVSMRSVLLAVVIALCAVLAPAVTPVSIGAPPPKSKTSVPKEDAPREERETSRVRLKVAAVERMARVSRPSAVMALVPRLVAGVVLVSAAEPIVVWRTPPALQVFRN